MFYMIFELFRPRYSWLKRSLKVCLSFSHSFRIKVTFPLKFRLGAIIFSSNLKKKRKIRQSAQNKMVLRKWPSKRVSAQIFLFSKKKDYKEQLINVYCSCYFIRFHFHFNIINVQTLFLCTLLKKESLYLKSNFSYRSQINWVNYWIKMVYFFVCECYFVILIGI